ncbi:MerR family DNA-binding protein [Micromonospora sp. CPCC 206171]|uniref:MerR family DNA-binding protein n=1 Tax=Micromonospora sp. CPCC 206171 TaxID=3122405 RepID=UPI002FF34795
MPRRSGRRAGIGSTPSDTVTLLRIIKTAQRLGFTLSEVADLLDAGRHRHLGRPDAGLQARAKDKLPTRRKERPCRHLLTGRAASSPPA